MSGNTNPDGKQSEQVGLVEILAGTLFGGGVDGLYHLALEFALTEASRGHVECAREAIRHLPEQHLRAGISGAALLSQLAAEILAARSILPSPGREPTGHATAPAT